jgi:hydrophobic/amphiphilic exporter-1 (mainly G- bacteria), HAE1 family
MWLSFLIHRPIAVLTLTFLLVFLGLSIIFLDKLKVDILPEMEIEKLMVSIDHSSNAIEQNDLLRKMQLLVNSLHRLENVTDVRAATLVDKTLIKISYLPQLAKQNRKLEAIRFLESYWIQEKINLPPPFIYEGGVDGLPIAYYALSFKENIPIFKSKQILELEIIPALQQLSGTSIIDLSSQSQYELAIEWKAETIATYGQNISQFEDQLKSLLTPRQTIKQIDNHNSETIQFEGIQKNLDKIKNATLYYNFNKSILKDLANVEIKEVTPRPITIDGKNKPVYIFKIFSSDGNIIKNNEEIKASLSSFSDKYGLSYETFENNSDLLNISLANIISSIVLALLIVSVLVIVLYKNLYLALSIVFTMVATFAISCLLMYLGSIEISLVSLLAIYLVIGLLVDYTVIILESTIINKQDLTETSIVKNVSSVNAGLWGAMLTNFLVFIPFIFLANKLGFFIKEFVIVLLST